MTGHAPAVYDRHYAKPFRDEEERAKVRESLASIGFGSASVDPTVDLRRSEVVLRVDAENESLAVAGLSRMGLF